jgi:hypothetical protein
MADRNGKRDVLEIVYARPAHFDGFFYHLLNGRRQYIEGKFAAAANIHDNPISCASEAQNC